MDIKTYLHIFMDKHASIVERLLFVMDGRDKYPWGHSIGLGKGVIDGMTRTGSIPGGDTLVAIRKCENARIDWILDGTGEPYITSKVLNDVDALELLEELMLETWSIYLLSDQRRKAIVLTRPGSFSVKDGKDGNGEQQFRWVQYTIVEVIVGAIGTKTMDFLRRKAKTRQVYFVQLSEQQMTSIERGLIGTYQLSKNEGILSAPDAISDKHPVFTQTDGQESFDFTKEEIRVIDRLRSMSDDGREAVSRVIDVIQPQK